MARHTNAKLVKTTLNSLLPRGKYEIRTVSRTEIEKVSREMHADRGFMKRNTASGLRARICIYFMAGVMGSFFMFGGIFASLMAEEKRQSMHNVPDVMWLLLVAYLSWVAGLVLGSGCTRYTIVRMTQNAYKLEKIVKQC